VAAESGVWLVVRRISEDSRITSCCRRNACSHHQKGRKEAKESDYSLSWLPMKGELLRKFSKCLITAASTTFALKAGVWFRQGRSLIVHSDSQGTACPLSGKTSTNRPVQICGTNSNRLRFLAASAHASLRTGDDASTVRAPRGVTVACKAASVCLYWLPSAGVLLRE
jgi:hypothetical protein